MSVYHYLRNIQENKLQYKVRFKGLQMYFDFMDIYQHMS